jgi:hypothetical protein
MILFSFITNDPLLAKMAHAGGVGRLFVDLEIIGKNERQGHLDTVISRHSFDDIALVRKAVPTAELLVRLNPYYDGSAEEIDRAIAHGADLLMLPMIQNIDQVKEFSSLVDDRIGVVPLLETPESIAVAADVAEIPGVVELYVGLNDLHLALNQKFMFQPLVDGIVDPVAEVAKSHDLRFGFGGIARVGEGLIPGELVLAEHVRLKSDSVILSRTFFRPNDIERSGEDPYEVFAGEISKLRQEEIKLTQLTKDELKLIHLELAKRVSRISGVVTADEEVDCNA